MTAPAAAFVFPLPAGAKGVAGAGSWTQDQGVDIAAPGGTPLLAVGAGTIVREGISGFGPWAPVLKLDTPLPSGQDYVYYGHTGPDTVTVGQHVTAGERISEVGQGIVGISTGPHLELGISSSPNPPALGATSAETLSLLKGASSSGGSGGGGLLSVPGDVAGAVGSAASSAFNAVTGVPGDIGGAVSSAVSGVFSGFFNYVKDSALKAALYAVLIIGGVSLAFYGLTRTVASRRAAGGVAVPPIPLEV